MKTIKITHSLTMPTYSTVEQGVKECPIDMMCFIKDRGLGSVWFKNKHKEFTHMFDTEMSEKKIESNFIVEREAIDGVFSRKPKDYRPMINERSNAHYEGVARVLAEFKKVYDVCEDKNLLDQSLSIFLKQAK